MNSPLSGAIPPGSDICYDRVTRVAAMSLISPIALLSLIDAETDTVRLASVFGADAACAHTMLDELGAGFLRHSLAIDDARLDTRFHDAVTGCLMGAVACCNAPLTDECGVVVGSLCVVDTRPRQWSSVEIETLMDVAALAMRQRPADVSSSAATPAESPGFFSHMPAWFARHTTLGLLAVDPKGRCLWGNPACEQMLGMPLAAMQGRGIADVLQPLQPDDAMDIAVAEVLQSGKSQQRESHISAFGFGSYDTERFMSVNIAPIEHDGKVIGAGIILTETSDRRKRESDLRLAEEKLALACEAANVGLWFWDLRSNQLEWTERCRGIFGLSASAPVNYEIFSDLVHPDDKSAMEQAMESALAGQTPGYHALFRILLADNRVRWIEVRGRLFSDRLGEPAHFMGAMLDVTEIKQNEAMLQARSEALLTLNDKLAELVEVRTGELQLLSQSLIELAEKEKAELARELHDQLGALLTVAHMEVAGALRRLTDKESDLYQQLTRARETIQETTMLKRRVVEGLRPALLESLGLAEALRALVDQYTAAALVECHAEIPEEIRGLSHDLSIALYRIAQESLTNIARYAEASEVSLRVEQSGGSISLEIADNGRGLPEDFRARSTAHGIAGMQQRAAHFKGVFSIMNRTDGPGTRVTVVIPLAESSQAA